MRLGEGINVGRAGPIGRQLFLFHVCKIMRLLKIALTFLKNNRLRGDINRGINKDNKADFVDRGKRIKMRELC